MARSMFGDAQPIAEGEAKDLTPRVRRKPIIKGGATSSKYISAATQGGADRTYQDVAIGQIRDSPIRDRIDIEEDIDSLVDSIRENGQQIPIHVRVVQGDLPYEIVVGRRRLHALRKLGHTHVKAFVSKLDDREAFVAQGIENSARLETSYIERARAASLSLSAGYQQVDVAQFLNLSQTMMSFMVRAYERLGEELVVLIGPARTIGRRKWDALIKAMTENDLSADDLCMLVDGSISDSTERFEALLKHVQSGVTMDQNQNPKPASANKPRITAQRRQFLKGAVSTIRKPNMLTIKADATVSDQFLDELYQKLEELVAERMKAQEE